MRIPVHARDKLALRSRAEHSAVGTSVTRFRKSNLLQIVFVPFVRGVEAGLTKSALSYRNGHVRVQGRGVAQSGKSFRRIVFCNSGGIMSTFPVRKFTEAPTL